MLVCNPEKSCEENLRDHVCEATFHSRASSIMSTTECSARPASARDLIEGQARSSAASARAALARELLLEREELLAAQARRLSDASNQRVAAAKAAMSEVQSRCDALSAALEEESRHRRRLEEDWAREHREAAASGAEAAERARREVEAAWAQQRALPVQLRIALRELSLCETQARHETLRLETPPAK